MKRRFALLLTVIALCSLCACASDAGSSSTDEQTAPARPSTQETVHAPNSTASRETEARNTEGVEYAEYQITRLNGSIRVPKRYYVFGDDQAYTAQMCSDVCVNPDDMEKAIPLLEGQTLIVPAGQPYADSVRFYLKVKEKQYDDLTLSELSASDYNTVASTIVGSFGVQDYETVEENGLRFLVFSTHSGSGSVLRYATILNGHMIYVYASGGDNELNEQERSDLAYIALSIQHALQ